MDVGLQDVAWLQEDSGQVIFQLESSQTSVKGVHDVRVRARRQEAARIVVPHAPGKLRPSWAMPEIPSTAY